MTSRRARGVLARLVGVRPALLILVSVLVSASAACAECRRPAPTPDARPGVADASASGRYLALGDSFTIGTGSDPSRSFPARLVDRWQAGGCSVTLENVAVNGYTTDDVIEQELQIVASFRPTFVTVAVGANDIAQGHSLDAYRANVRRILDAAKAGGARVVVIPQPDWSRSPSAASFGTQAALAEAISAFNAALAEEARGRHVGWLDLGPLMRQQALSGQLAADGLHPSAEAYDAWAGELARALTPPCP